MKSERATSFRVSTETHLRVLGRSLKKVFPVPRDDRFAKLIDALDRVRRDGSGRDAAYLRKQAARCRWLASVQSDTFMRETLRRLADDYDIRADDQVRSR